MTIRVSRQLPTHLDLPDTDGIPMNNLWQLAQIRLMSFVLRATLAALHPENDY